MNLFYVKQVSKKEKTKQLKTKQQESDLLEEVKNASLEVKLS